MKYNLVFAGGEYLLNKPGKSIALTRRIGEIRPVLGQCDALRPEILR